ncbi:MAG: hypothetical protein J5854_01140 [Clostridia bacterium]|nr:hypothetical protein [Clostridia bacterium]
MKTGKDDKTDLDGFFDPTASNAVLHIHGFSGGAVFISDVNRYAEGHSTFRTEEDPPLGADDNKPVF